MSTTLQQIGLWCVTHRISSKPVKCIDLGNGKIKVVRSCRIEQPRDERHESYHETYEAAVARFLEDARRDVADAERQLKNAKRRLTNAEAKYPTK